MTAGVVRRLLLVGVLLLLPVLVFAQEAVLTGTVTDSTGGVLPGVTVTAVHEATGNRFVGVTDGRGIFRIPARIGHTRSTSELPGFTTVSRTGVPLLVGQTATVDIQMAPSTLQETVTVTGEAPLLDVATSSIGGNIDQRQMQELPVQGRDWTALALLAPGNRTTSMGGTPVQDRADVREYQLNVDGQQVTQQLGIGGQPLYSRDSIAEFQFISNRFDATQGRSSGVQVNAISKSGTNTVSGLFTGAFRDSDWNAEDHVLEPGDPVLEPAVQRRRGRAHSARPPALLRQLRIRPDAEDEHLEHALPRVQRHPEREGVEEDRRRPPRLPDLAEHAADGEGVTAPTTSSRLAPRARRMHPASTNSEDRVNREYLGQFTHVISNRALNEVKVGFAEWNILQGNLTNWSNHWARDLGVTEGHPRVQMVGFQIAGNQNAPRIRDQNSYMLRDDFTFNYDARGRHDLKAGVEYVYLRRVHAQLPQLHVGRSTRA